MYQFVYHEGKENHPLFVVLHGTGGNENNLIPIALEIDADANVLGIRGDVNENGLLRFFKRNGEGNYDIPDLFERGDRLNKFILQKAKELNFEPEEIILLGFSNGANIALHMMLDESTPIQTAFLLSPMYPVEREIKRDLTNTNIFISAGTSDPIVPTTHSKDVIDIFESRGANTITSWGVGHNLTPQNLKDAINFYQTLFNH